MIRNTRFSHSRLALALATALAISLVVGCSAEPTESLFSAALVGRPKEANSSSLTLGGQNKFDAGRLTSMAHGISSSMQDSLGLEPEEESLPEDLADPVLANRVTNSPFPDRTNPFEFGNGVDFDAPQAKQSEGQSLKLYGFAGSDHPKAIFHIDGKTKMLSAGEKWGALEVLEVTPPTVRVKANGVARVWSLLGHHEQSEL